ncbi:hypothetical protein KY092_09410 [Natronomonas gomsonensis]|jgi:hypothetical protein|uniref:hypothetical protein n=1 Tax=Natronomonas gomsonensis TaxID=1046043 RepID=UPI0020CA2C3B|nr:hypothetical protein [Natronomonas gomsonensis]MCY4730772.1 hypothetical protein [Natronomonas gomsonensis]
MSRFADLGPTARRSDPAMGPIPDCAHPRDSRKRPDSGGALGSPSFYCDACGRLVIQR